MLRTAARMSARVLFFGTDEFSLSSLQMLHQMQQEESSAVEHLEVVVPPDKRRNRRRVVPVPVKSYALDHGIPVHEVPHGVGPRGLAEWDCPMGFDIGVVVSFGYFIYPSTLDRLRKGAINVHPSRLPRYRGAAPIQWTLLRGDVATAVSVIDVHPEKFDSGKILASQEHPANVRFFPHNSKTILSVNLSTLKNIT